MISFAVILLPFALILIFAGFVFSENISEKFQDLFIPTVLIFTFLIFVSTELLSLLNFYCYTGLIIFWGPFDFLFALLLIVKFKPKLKTVLSGFQLSKKFCYLNSGTKILWLIIVLLISGFFLQGLIYPPNNWDSMTYHMARIIHWVQNENVNYYPTNIFRQLYQPPFAEYCIAQIFILSGNDLFANSVQLFFLYSTLFVVAGISKELGFTASQQLITVIFTLTIPEVILQASSTQNDIVASFFIGSSIYYMMLSLKKRSIFIYIFLGISLAFAVLTKATAYLFLAPALLFFFIISISKIFHQRRADFIMGYLIFICFFFIINGGYFYRNLKLNHNLFGTSATENRIYQNSIHSLPMLVSNITRNTALHFGVPVFSKFSESGTKKIHYWIGMEPNDQRITWDFIDTFRIQPFGTHEDYGANIIHIVLMIFSILIFILFFKKIDRGMMLYFIVMVSQFLVFCIYLKLQPWHSRLHTPLFILFTPVLSFLLTKFFPRKLRYPMISLFLVYAVLVFLFNYSRPMIPIENYTAKISLGDVRFKKYFTNRLRNYAEFRQVNARIKNHKDQLIGVEFQADDCEYPFFKDISQDPIKSYHLVIENESRYIECLHPVPDCIISTKNQVSLTYHNLNYHNFTPNNSTIYYYRPLREN